MYFFTFYVYHTATPPKPCLPRRNLAETSLNPRKNFAKKKGVLCIQIVNYLNPKIRPGDKRPDDMTNNTQIIQALWMIDFGVEKLPKIIQVCSKLI